MITSARLSKPRLTVVVVALQLIFVRASCVAMTENSRLASLCSIESITDSIFGFRDQNCVVSCGGFVSTESPHSAGVTEGDEVSLRKALIEVNNKYVAVIFYASWCPFSKDLRPKFSLISALYPSIPHFAIEESSVRLSVLSRYLVRGFPTLFIENSTRREYYHGSRTLASLIAFYSDITGIKTASLDKQTLDKIAHLSNLERRENNRQESQPLSWARSPEDMLRQETYLALACAFVLLRLLYFVSPTLLVCAQSIWRMDIHNMRSGSLLEGPWFYVHRVMQLVNSLQQSCKRK